MVKLFVMMKKGGTSYKIKDKKVKTKMICKSAKFLETSKDDMPKSDFRIGYVNKYLNLIGFAGYNMFFKF